MKRIERHFGRKIVELRTVEVNRAHLTGRIRPALTLLSTRKSKLLDEVCEGLRSRHHHAAPSGPIATGASDFHGVLHPAQISEPEIRVF